MKTIGRRLQTLERSIRPAAEDASNSGLSVVEQITEGLTKAGIIQGELESLAETLARTMKIPVSELRERLQNRAAGLPAE